MNSNIWSRLVLPLAILFVFAIFMNSQWEADGFFINLATEVIGILLTVSYVNWVVETHERRKWQTTNERVRNRLLIVLNGIVTGIRSSLGVYPDVIDQRVIATGEITAISKEVMRVALEVILPTVYQQLRLLRQEGWRNLATNTRNANNEIIAFLNMFQSRLSPDQISTLLDIQEKLEHSLIFYETFPDLAGVPKDKLPATRTPPEELQQHGYETTAKNLQRALELVSKLSRSMTMNA